MLGRVFTAVPAAGSGIRMGLGYSKAYADVDGKPVLAVEYVEDGRDWDAACAQAKAMGIALLLSTALWAPTQTPLPDPMASPVKTRFSSWRK